jgi:Ca2+-binding EF-hand superfamily protein
MEGSMRRMAIVIFTASLICGLPTLSVAQTGMTQIGKSVREIDKNFDVADKNHDGKLTRAEAQSGSTPMIANHFDAIDTGHKGYVTKDDVHAFIRRNLTRGHPAAAGSSP